MSDFNTDTVLLFPHYGMGSAEPELQLKLISTYLRLLDENGVLPGVICLYTDGVKLAVDSSPVIEILKSIESKGVHIILCSTCLNFFNLTNRVQVGIIGGMTDIIEAQRKAVKVVTL